MLLPGFLSTFCTNDFRSDWRLGMIVFLYRMWIKVFRRFSMLFPHLVGTKTYPFDCMVLYCLPWNENVWETCIQFFNDEVFTRHIPQNANFSSITHGCHYVVPSPNTLVHWCHGHYTTQIFIQKQHGCYLTFGLDLVPSRENEVYRSEVKLMRRRLWAGPRPWLLMTLVYLVRSREIPKRS
jgi:hypothetical protein